jgi:hypothetical protein
VSLEIPEAAEDPAESLIDAIRLAQGFTLYCLEAVDFLESTRIMLRAGLDLGEASDQEFVELQRDSDPLATLLPNFQPNRIIFLGGLETWLRPEESGVPLFSRLNSQRNLIIQKIPCCLVFCAPAYVMRLLAREAPDFFSIRSGYFVQRAPNLRMDFLVWPIFPELGHYTFEDRIRLYHKFLRAAPRLDQDSQLGPAHFLSLARQFALLGRTKSALSTMNLIWKMVERANLNDEGLTFQLLTTHFFLLVDYFYKQRSWLRQIEPNIKEPVELSPAELLDRFSKLSFAVCRSSLPLIKLRSDRATSKLLANGFFQHGAYLVCVGLLRLILDKKLIEPHWMKFCDGGEAKYLEAYFHLSRNDLKLAQESLEQSLKIFHGNFGARHPQVALTTLLLAYVKRLRGQAGPGLQQILSTSIRYLEDTLGPQHEFKLMVEALEGRQPNAEICFNSWFEEEPQAEELWAELRPRWGNVEFQPYRFEGPIGREVSKMTPDLKTDLSIE